MAQLVKTLRYKPDDRGFGSRWVHWDHLLFNPSGRSVGLGLTPPLTEMSTRDIS